MTTYHFDEDSLKRLTVSIHAAAIEAAKRITESRHRVNNKMSNDLQDPIKFIEEMLRKARRGEVTLTACRIKNMQPDRWESLGAGRPDRLRMDNAFKIELEMYVPDRGAMSQPDRTAVEVDIDSSAVEAITPPGSGAPVFEDYTLTDYDVARGVLLDRAARNRHVESTAKRLAAIGEARRATLNERMRVVPSTGRPDGNARTRRAEKRAVNRQEEAKPKTPAGASAAREIIFDD